MKKTTTKRPLRLAAETVRVLQSSQLTSVNGGVTTACLSVKSKQGQMSCDSYCEPPE